MPIVRYADRNKDIQNYQQKEIQTNIYADRDANRI